MIPLFDMNRQTTRAPLNPMDKCTIVSIYPLPFTAVKYTIQPGIFEVPAGSITNPGILVVGSSSWWRSVGEESPLLEIPTGALQVADSIVTDWLRGIDGCDMAERMPGVFYLVGELTVKDVITNHLLKLKQAETRQKNWFQEVVKQADILWARSNGNPLAISNSARLGCEHLGLKDKVWMKDFATLKLENCPACGTLRNNSYPVCANCKTIIDVDAFKKQKFEKTE